MAVTITNSSSIAIGIVLPGGETLTNTTAGTIIAPAYAVYSANGGSAATVLNAGIIMGGGAGIDLRAGGAVTNAANASISGTVAGVLITGAAGTVSNYGGISGSGTSGDGINLTAGGMVTNGIGGVISAGDFGVSLYGGTLVNLGRIGSTNTIRAGVFLSTGFATVTNQSGGTIAAGGNGIYGTTMADTVVNAGLVQGTQGAGVMLVSGGAVTNQLDGTISGSTEGIYVRSGLGTVVNGGLVTGSATGGVDLAAGGTVTNLSGGTISGPVYGVIANGANATTVVNAGLVAGAGQGGIRLSAGGAVTQAPNGTITGGKYGVLLSGGVGTVVNAGSIAGGQTGIYGSAAVDSVVNAGVVEGTTGGGVILTAAGAITNQPGGTIGGGGLGVYVRGGAGSVVNQGLITVTGFGRIAADFAAGGTISNQNGATIGGQADGVVVSGGIGTVTNAGVIDGPVDAGVLLYAGGTISQAAGGTIIGGIYGVQLLGAAATVVTAGSITGGNDAVLLNPGTANRLVVDPGAVFSGKIDGGNAVGSTAVSTLELASGASVGTISGFGSQYQDFGVVAIDNGARWNLGGTVAAGTTIAFPSGGYGALTIADPGSMSGTITGFGSGETLSLTGITATGSSYANGVLTLTEASGAVALDLPGSFTTSDFAVSNVSGNAEVTIGNPGLLESLNVNQQLELIYIAYFNRAADDPGFMYWGAQNVQAQAEGQNAATALTNIANAFAPQPETIALYPFLGQSNVDLSSPAGQTGLNNFVDAIYGNLFDRAADAAGAAYWVGQLTGGAVALGAAALAIANGATGADAIEVQNKVAVALDFTTKTGAAGLGETSPLAASFLTAAKSVLSGVDGTSLNDASVTAGENATTAFINGSANGETMAAAASGSTDTNGMTVTNSDQLIDPGAGMSQSSSSTGGPAADNQAFTSVLLPDLQSQLENLFQFSNLPTLQGFTQQFSLSTRVLQISTSQIALATNGYTLLIQGNGVSIPNAILTALLNPGSFSLSSIGGTVTGLQLYSGGTFSDGAVSGGTEIVAATFSTTAMTVTTGSAELVIDGANLPITPVTVAEIAAGSYSGPPISISAVEIFNDGSQIGSLTLGASSLTFVADDYRLVLNGTFPTSLSASLIDSLVGGGNADGLNISVSSAQLSRVSTGQVLVNVPNVATLDFTGLSLNDIPGSLVSLAAAASGGDSLSVNTGTMLTPLDATLNGGTIEIAGVGSAAVLGFSGDAAITASNPSIDGESTISNLISGQNGAGVTVLDAVGTFVNQGLILADGPDGGTFTINVEQNTTNSVTTPGIFYNDGTILAGAGNQMTITTGAGTELLNAGTLITTGGGTLEVTGGVAGTGILEISGNSTLRLDGTVAAGTPITFTAGGTGSLAIADPTSMLGTITGFAAGDALSLAGITATGSSYANGVLTLTGPSGAITLDLPGNFTTNNFAVSNGSGAAEVTIDDSGLLGGLTVSQQLELIYIAYFNRAADNLGYSYWDRQDVSAQNAASALAGIANAFAPQPETIALYPFLGQSNIDLSSPAGQTGLNNFVDAVYDNLFDRTADAAGAAYWVGQLTTGAVGLGAAALAIANGATGTDAIEVQNKIAVALDFTTSTGAAGLGEASPLASSFLTTARSVLSGVDGTSLNDASVTAGESATTAYINGSASGETTAVTTGAEMVSATNVITVIGSDQLIDPGTGSYTIQFLPAASADTLVLHAGGVDQVSGFVPGTDALDVASLLGAAGIDLNGDVTALGNYVTITDQGSDALVNFDPAGHGGGSTVAVLQGLGSTVTGLDTLVARGAIRMA